MKSTQFSQVNLTILLKRFKGLLFVLNGNRNQLAFCYFHFHFFLNYHQLSHFFMLPAIYYEDAALYDLFEIFLSVW